MSGLADPEFAVTTAAGACGIRNGGDGLPRRPRSADFVCKSRKSDDVKGSQESEGQLLAQSGPSFGGLSQRRARLRRTFELRLRVRQRRT